MAWHGHAWLLESQKVHEAACLGGKVFEVFHLTSATQALERTAFEAMRQPNLEEAEKAIAS